MYFPVYKKNMPHTTVSERRTHLLGWVFIQFRMNDLMQGILDDHHHDIDLEIFDGKETTKESLMYDDDKVLRLHQSYSKGFEFTENISVLEHSWTINIYALEGFFSKASLSQTASITKTGIILSFMVATLFWLLIKMREQSERLAKSITVDLQESESRFKFAIEDSGDGLWDWDLANKNLFFSNRAKELLGLDPTEVEDNITAWEQSIYIDDKPEAISEMQACLGSKTSQYASEYRIHSKDGSMKWILDRGTVIKRDENGKPLRMIGTLTDISERKKWESDLMESEQRFRIVANAAPVLIWKSDVDKLCYWFNKTWLDFTGRTLEQEQGNGWAEGVHPDDLKLCFEIYTSHFDARQPFYMEYRLRRHDGEYRWLSDSGVPRIDEQGVFSGYIGSCSDITVTKQAQIALQESEHLAQQTLTELQYQKYALDQHAIVATTDVHGAISYVNDKFCQISGYSQQELIGQNHRILNSGHHPKEFFKNLYQTILQGKVWNGEICNRAKNGRLYWVMTTIVPFLDGKGKPLQFIAIRTDITERKNADAKLQESLNEKEMLLKEVYHRVKNNLQVVSSLVNLQAATIENKEAIELLKQSADRIKSMALLHEKLYQSKDLAKIDFNDYIRSLVEHLQFGFGCRLDLIKFNINIANIFLDVDAAIPCGLIVNEVVSNSLKHAFPGNREGSIEISLTQELDEITLVISDNGVGFPDNWELKNSTSLGLELVNELSRQLFGNMTLDKEDGSKFTLRFNPNLIASQAHVFHPAQVVAMGSN